MARRPTRRNLVLLAVAGLAMLAAAGQFIRSPAAREAAAELLSPVAAWWSTPGLTRAEEHAAELERRLAERVPRPARERYPDRPRVALMDFRVDRDTWAGARTARELSDIARAALDADSRFEWVDRAALDAAAGEAALGMVAGAGDASMSVELGAWLGCDLLVTGTFLDTGRDAQRLRLEVVDLLTADRVSEAELPWAADLARPGTLPDAELDRLLVATRELIDSAHERLVSLRDAPVLSLLFFRNATGHDRLDHLEATMPERLEAEARDQPGVRLVRVTRAADAGEEQTLALNGLTRRDPEAWASAADRYLWGYVAESGDASPDPAGGSIVMSPDRVPTTVTLYLWSGIDAPQRFTRTVPAGELDDAVVELAGEVWAAAQAPVPDQVSPGQRDAVVALLTRGPTAATLGGGSDAGGGSRTLNSSSEPSERLAWQAAAFFRPDDEKLADVALVMLRPLTPGRRWIGLADREATMDRVIARHGAGIRDMFFGLPQKLAVLQARATLLRGRTYRFHSLLGAGRSELPADMPPAARAAYRQETLASLIAFGRLLATAPTATEGHARVARREIDPDDVLFDDLRLNDVEVAEIWTAWWPVLRPGWEEERLDASRFHFDAGLLDRLSRAYAAVGRAGEYEAMFVLKPALDAAGVPGVPGVPVPPLNPEAAANVRAWVEARVAEGLLRPEPAARVEPAAPPAPPVERPATPMASGLAADAPPHLRARLEESRRLREARFGEGTGWAAGSPRHVEEPAVAPAAAVARLNLHWDLSPGRELTLPPRGGAAGIRRVVPWLGRYAGLRVSRRSPPDAAAPPEGLGLLDPLTLRVTPLHERIGDARWNDLAASATRLWLATADDGLYLMRPWGEEPWGVGTRDGLISGDIRRVAFDGTRLWVLSGDGRLGLVENPDGDTAGLEALDARVEERFAADRLEAAAGRVAVRGEGPGGPWFWVGTGGVEPLVGWLGGAGHPGATVADVRADGESFWVVLATRLLRVSGAGEVLSDLPLHPPPVESLRVRADGSLIWMAYGWEEPEDEPATRAGHFPGDADPPARTRLLAVDAASGVVLGQTEHDGAIVDFFVTPGEVHLFAPSEERDVVMLRRDGLLVAMGLTGASATAASEDAAPPLGVPADAWAAYRGERPPPGALQPADPDAWPPLLAAVRGGRAGTVEALLAAGADPDAATYGRFSHNAALLAVLLDRPDLLDLLHAAGADMNVTHAAFGTLVHAAVLVDSPRCVARLAALGADLDAYARIAGPAMVFHNEPAAYRCASLHLAVHRGRLACLRALLDAGASVRDDRLEADRMIPLTDALRGRHEDAANLLLDRGVDPKRAEAGRFSALETAVGWAAPATLNRLLAGGADAGRPGVLSGAIRRGDAAVVGRLLEAGADPLAVDEFDVDDSLSGYGVPMLEALSDRRLDLYRFVTPSASPALERRVSGAWRLGDFAARLAAEKGFRDEAIDLAARGFRVDAPGREGRTLLAELVARARPGGNEPEDTARIELLLALGADPAATDAEGRSAVSLARSEAVRELLQNPAAAAARLRGTPP